MASNFPQKCPAQPGKYYIENLTIIENGGSPLYSLFEQMSPVQIPNGVYRTVANFYAESELSVLCTFDAEIYDKMNEDKF